MPEVGLSDRIVDRERERELFRALLANAEAPRLLTVRADSGTGKSMLLQVFEEEASRQRAAVCRHALADDEDVLQVVQTMAKGLEACGAITGRFKRLIHARGMSDFAAFGMPEPQSVNVQLTANHSSFFNSPIRGAQIDTSRPAWSSGHEEVARDACLAALVDDLRALSSSRTIVVMIDQFEKRATELKSWLAGVLLNHVFAEADPFGALLVVIASQEPILPNLALQLGDRRDDLMPTIEHLSTWTDDHIRLWIAKSGHPDPEPFVPAVRSLLMSGVSLKDLELWWAYTETKLSGPRP